MNQVAKSYDVNPQREWERLERDPYHSLEFLVTWHYLRKHLPPSGKVLDAGGGPGRYSLELCRAGYNVVLLDISPRLISLAKEQFESESEEVQNRLLEFVVGDIQDLARLANSSFDAVLCLGGPLTHISNEEGRCRAMAELVRVAKTNAIVCVSVMGYLAVLRTVAIRFSDDLPSPAYQKLVDTGDATGKTATVWHFFRVEELRSFAESFGLQTIELAGCEGLAAGCADATNLLGKDAAKWKAWTDVILKTSAEPSAADMSEHILYVGRATKS